MNRDRLAKQLISDEKLEHFVYPDQFGYWTIGVGRCVDNRKGKGLSTSECLYLLDNDINDWVWELQQDLPWISSLDDLRQEVLINMSHQMGIGGLLEFKHFLAYLQAGDYKNAATAGLDSLWAKEQTPERAQREMRMIETGKVNGG